MKIKTILLGIGLLFTFQSIAQTTLKNGEFWDFRGTYHYTDLDGEYTLDIFGSEGRFEADLTFKGSEEKFKMSCDGEWDDDKTLTISYVKIWEGSSSKENAFKSDKNLLKLVIDGNDCKTEIGSLSLGGFEKGFSEIMFIKEADAGEGPP